MVAISELFSAQKTPIREPGEREGATWDGSIRFASHLSIIVVRILAENDHLNLIEGRSIECLEDQAFRRIGGFAVRPLPIQILFNALEIIASKQALKMR